MELRAAFDIDGVILDADEILKDNFECQGYKVINNHEYEYQLEPEPEQWVVQEMVEDCIERRTVDMDVFDGVQEMFSRIWDKVRRPPLFVTHRQPSAASTTTLALMRALGDIPFSLSHTQGKSKALFLKDYPVFVEDRLDEAVALAMMGKIVIVPKRRYNWPVDVPAFNPRRMWTWLELEDLQHYSIDGRGAPSLWWYGRIIFIESMESFLTNEKLFSLLLAE